MDNYLADTDDGGVKSFKKAKDTIFIKNHNIHWILVKNISLNSLEDKRR